GGAAEEPGRCLPLRGRVQALLELHPPLHPRPLLRLCLRLRGLPGEFALRRLRARRARLPGALPRHAARGRHAPPQGAPGTLRARRLRPGLLGQGAGADRALHRRARGDTLMARKKVAPRTEGRPGKGEQSTFGARVKRYARVGRAVGGLAVELAGKRYLGFSLDRGRHASELATALGGLKGPLMKVAQLLSTIPDALPSEYASELSRLQADAPAMGWPFVRRRMAAELGPDWLERFKSFERGAARAASLGQVHRAVSLDGRALAAKLQYPEMASVVAADLAQLKLVFALYERYDKAISTRHIHAEIAERLGEELDYEREARQVRLYREMLRSEAGVHVPEVLPALSTRRLLTMTWLEGAPLVDCKEWPLERRNKVAYNMFRAWYVPFYFYGVIHGDPHLGNYTVRPDGSINLMDFGCIRVFKSP